MCAWLLILCAFCSLGATSAQAVDVTGLGKITVASGAADWGIGALQQALDAQMSAVYNVSRAVVVGIGAAEMLDATNNYIDSRPETQYLAGRITLPDLVSTWLNEYARAKSIEDLGQIYEQLQSGITVDSDGVMYYNGQACAFMDEFCDWVWTSGPKLEDYASEIPDDSIVSDGDFQAALVSCSNVINGSYYCSQPIEPMTNSSGTVNSNAYRCYIARVPGISFYAGCVDNSGGSYPTYYNLISGVSGGVVYQGIVEKLSNGSYSVTTANSQRFSATGPSNSWALQSWRWPVDQYGLPVNSAAPGSAVGEIKPAGSIKVGNPGLFGGLSSLSVNPSDFVSVQQPEGDGWKVAPSEWLRVVTDVVSGDDKTTMTVTQDDTGVTQRVVVTPPDLPGVPGDPIQPAPEINPTVPDTTVPTFDLPDITGDWNGTSSYEVNIRDLFPFCIPFDILDACQLFAAEPVAPAFSIPIKSEAYGIDETVEFDLSPFDGVASAVRTVEKVAFLVGLALVTKQLLGG